MKEIVKFLKQTFQDVDGMYSSKRFVVIIFALAMLAVVGVNLFTGLTVEAFMFESITYIVIAGLGMCGAEKFAPKKVRAETEASAAE